MVLLNMFPFMDPGELQMKPGELYRVHVPLDAHPRDDYLNGMIVVILGEKYEPPSILGEYVKCLGDRIRMFPTRWLEVLR